MSKTAFCAGARSANTRRSARAGGGGIEIYPDHFEAGGSLAKDDLDAHVLASRRHPGARIGASRHRLDARWERAAGPELTDQPAAAIVESIPVDGIRASGAKSVGHGKIIEVERIRRHAEAIQRQHAGEERAADAVPPLDERCGDPILGWFAVLTGLDDGPDVVIGERHHLPRRPERIIGKAIRERRD